MGLTSEIHNISWVEPEKSCYPSCLLENLNGLNENIKFKFWYVVSKNKDFVNPRFEFGEQTLKNFYISDKEDLVEIINSDLLIIDGYRFCDKL